MLKEFNKLRMLFDRRDKLQYGGLLILMGIGALLEVVGIGAVPAFVSTLAVPEKVFEFPIAAEILTFLGITEARQLVLWGAVGLIGVFAFRTAYLIFLSYIRFRMTENHSVRIAHNLFTKYMNAPYEFHLNRNTAELLRNVNSEAKSVITGIINPLLTITLNGLMTLFIVILLVVSTPWSGLVAIIVVGGGGWAFLNLIKSRMRRYGKGARTERKRSIQAVNQGLGGLQDARILGVEKSLIDDFYDSISKFARYNRFRQFIAGLANPLLEFIAVAGLMLVVFTMVIAGLELANMVPMLALFGAAIVRLRGSVGSITTAASGLSFNVASVEAVVGDLEVLKEFDRKDRSRKEGKNQTSEKLTFHKEVQLQNITYTYPNSSEAALKDITLSINPGESVGFVGATGSGKTTLINVLLGLLQPEIGNITVDGADIYQNIRAWQNNLGYIPQSIYLIDDTLKKNIAFGISDVDIDEEQLWTAIRAAQLESYILSLEDGVETHAGERGVRLSGGQRQRIGLARALYHNPDILVMDEATSALDNETENEVMKAVDSLKGNRTLIMIAHRLSTVRKCNRLYFLKDGSIEASGTYEELKNVHSDFRRMADVA